MELFDNLASHGLTITVLQTLIVCAGLLFVIYVIGLYWQFILTGFGILFCIAVFAMPSKQDKPVVEKSVQQQESKVEEVKPEPPVEEKPKVAQTDEEMFMEDCVTYGGYTKSQCGALWLERLDDEKKVKFRKTFNKIQMMKVKYGT
jgi:hypothetical protein